MTVQTDLEFHLGENWIIQYEVNDGVGNNINLIGGSVEWTLATLASIPLMVLIVGDGITPTNALEGKFTLSVTPSHQSTAGITAGTTYRYELRVITAAGTVSVQGKGVIAVLPSLLA
jgi:hypothetical protein